MEPEITGRYRTSNNTITGGICSGELSSLPQSGVEYSKDETFGKDDAMTVLENSEAAEASIYEPRPLGPSLPVSVSTVVEHIRSISERLEHPIRDLAGDGIGDHPIHNHAKFGRRLPDSIVLGVIENHPELLRTELTNRYGTQAADASLTVLEDLGVGIVQRKVRHAALQRIEQTTERFELLQSMPPGEFEHRLRTAVAECHSQQDLRELFRCFGARSSVAADLAESVVDNGGEVSASTVQTLREALPRGLKNLERAEELSETPTALHDALFTEQFESVRIEVFERMGINPEHPQGDRLSELIDTRLRAQRRKEFGGQVALAAFTVAMSLGTGGIFGATMLGVRTGATAAVVESVAGVGTSALIDISHQAAEEGNAMADNRQMSSVRTTSERVGSAVTDEMMSVAVGAIPLGRPRVSTSVARDFSNNLASHAGVYAEGIFGLVEQGAEWTSSH